MVGVVSASAGKSLGRKREMENSVMGASETFNSTTCYSCTYSDSIGADDRCVRDPASWDAGANPISCPENTTHGCVTMRQWDKGKTSFEHWRAQPNHYNYKQNCSGAMRILQINRARRQSGFPTFIPCQRQDAHVLPKRRQSHQGDKLCDVSTVPLVARWPVFLARGSDADGEPHWFPGVKFGWSHYTGNYAYTAHTHTRCIGILSP